MGFTVGIYIHKNLKTNEPLDVEEVWLDIKNLLVRFGAKILPTQVDEKVLDEAHLIRSNNAFHRLFGVATQNSDDYWGCGFYYEGILGSDNQTPLFIPYSDDAIQVNEFLQFSMPLNEANLGLIKKIKHEFIEDGKYEFSYSYNIGIDATQLAK